MSRKNDERLMDDVTEELEKAGAKSVVIDKDDYSYTIVANVDKGNLGKMVLKISSDSSTIPRSHIVDLLIMHKVFNAKPILVDESRRNEELQDGVLYEHSGIPQLNPNTFRDLLKGKPLLFKNEGGVVKVRIKGWLLRELRMRYGLSLGDLAELLSVSRKAVYEYERGTIDVSAEKAQLLVELFGDEIVEGWSLSVKDPEQRIMERKVELGDVLHLKVKESYLLVHTHGKYATVTDNGNVLLGSENSREAEEVSNILGARYIRIQ